MVFILTDKGVESHNAFQLVRDFVCIGGNSVGCCSSNIYLSIIFTKKVFFLLPFFKELGYFASSFGGEMPLRQESIDSLWMARSVFGQLNLGEMDGGSKLCFNNRSYI